MPWFHPLQVAVTAVTSLGDSQKNTGCSTICTRGCSTILFPDFPETAIDLQLRTQTLAQEFLKYDTSTRKKTTSGLLRAEVPREHD
ncbi:hypothetical protein ACT3UD_08680 [Glutamicibacter sp. 287]|uniref:hypothetical protein n=1 Tax=unclassified Glutamicibacter TaxID=2627139 RepID=UPI0040336580